VTEDLPNIDSEVLVVLESGEYELGFTGGEEEDYILNI
jgi:hypothetical protein